jgi:hypothetical protein
MKRRSFVGAALAAPAVQLVQAAETGEKFTPVSLDALFNASAEDLGPREQTGGLVRPAGGEQAIQGIPFRLGPAATDRKRWLALSRTVRSWTVREAEIAVGRTAGFLCLAQFCDWEQAELNPESVDALESIGATLATATITYADGERRAFPVRRRFEVNPPRSAFGRECFNALSSNTWRTTRWPDPLARSTDWGFHQQGFVSQSPAPSALWLWALENPEPARVVKALRLEAAGDDLLLVCGLTLYHGKQHPLRRERRTLYRVTLPSKTAGEPDRWKVETDLGLVCRVWAQGEFRGEEWLKEPAGVGERAASVKDADCLYVEITAAAEAALKLSDAKTGARYEFDLAGIQPGEVRPAKPAGARVEVLERDKTWLRGRVTDAAGGRPTPVRLAFRSKEGRYIPPYGYRTEVNAAWFQDYGSDTQVGAASFAYVDGTFQAELPVGELYVELSKGFEYEAVRQRIKIEPGQRELELRIPRREDWRRKGWATADTHVHFLSTSTALLEAQAEGLNLVNLLAAQWGDLFTNIGDLPYGPLVSADRETVVQVGTENRQHLLGHLALLGGKGEPVFPLSADGPSEAYLGDPVWNSMSEWADECRKREGLVVAVHFPNPNAELAAEIVRGKIDAVELYPGGGGSFRTLGYQDWYRYLNCGYRVAAAGGTDKMAASTPVGGNRTYAYLGGAEFNFANWAKAVRSGRTFATTGPLLEFRVDGQMPGGEIRLRAGGGTVEVVVEASANVPFHRLEIVHNGKVAAWQEEKVGTRRMTMREKVTLGGPGWLAARCSSRVAAARFGVAAHTSPVYFTVPGSELFSGPAAAYFLKLIEGTQLYVDNLATRPDAERLERIRKTLREAHAELHRRVERNAR